MKSVSQTDWLADCDWTGVNYYNLTLGENEKDWSHLSNTDSFTPAPKTRVFMDWKKTILINKFPSLEIKSYLPVNVLRLSGSHLGIYYTKQRQRLRRDQESVRH